MTTNTPWQVRCFRCLEFTGLCALSCGALIGRPVYYWSGLIFGIAGACCHIVWLVAHAPARDLARTGDSTEARA